jgi:Icc-related predicted phosphoesterase
MKIALASDLHLEFGDIHLANDQGADVLLLAGDIMIAQDLHDHPAENLATGINLGTRQQAAQRYREFLARVSQEFPHVIYIAGNHEFYHGKFHASLDDLTNECSKFANVHFLENDTRVIDGITFVGCTLWTDMNKGDPLTLHTVAGMMNDYRIIREDSKGYTKLRPAHTLARHRRSLEYIRNAVGGKTGEKFVVVGHMAPSPQSTHERYRDDPIMNGAYSSDLSEFILDHPQIQAWVHGHTHYNFDYMIGTTRILCNPRGYVGYERGTQEEDPYHAQVFEV